MFDVLDSSAYLKRLLAAPRPGGASLLAFYDHRIGAITTDPRFVLAPLDDHLCHRGDGIFEAIVYRQRRLFQLDAHLERLRASAASLKLIPPCSWDELRASILAVARASGQDSGGIRVIIGRGPGSFGIAPADCPQSSLYIAAVTNHLPEEAWYRRGRTAFRSAVPAKQEYLARIKNTNYLPNVLMTEEARQRGMDVAVSFDEQDCLAEAAVANIALVDQNGTLVCPEFTHSLPGTTVQSAMELAAAFMQTCYRSIPAKEIPMAREMLLFGSTPLCVGITHFDGRPVGNGTPGPTAFLLRDLLWKKLLEEGTAF